MQKRETKELKDKKAEGFLGETMQAVSVVLTGAAVCRQFVSRLPYIQRLLSAFPPS